MGLEAVFYFVYIGLPFIAGLLGAWQAYRHRSRGERIWIIFALLTVVAFVGATLIGIAFSPLSGYAINQWRIPWWVILGAALAWFLLPLMVGVICLYKGYELMKQRNRKWIIYFAAGTPLTFIVPAIGLLITLLLTWTPGPMCYAPMPYSILSSNVLSVGMLIKRKTLLTKIYKEKKINKEVYEKIKRTLE